LALAACATPQQAQAPTAVNIVDQAARLETYRAAVRAQRAKIDDLMMRARGPVMSLYAAELAFNDDARKRGLQKAFAERFTDDGLLIGAGTPVAIGPAQVAASYADAEDWTLEWAPVEARMEGNLGVTWGIAALSFKDEKGALHARSTRYVTVWQRQDDGTWKIWIDTGTTGPLPKLD
jgi:ketosteroid isomerase-like protein